VADSVAEYLEDLPADRREAVEAVRATVLENLPDGFEEGIQYGMISWFVPLERFPDMGKSCLRFRKLEDLSLDVIGEAIARVSPEDLVSAHERRSG